MTDRDQVASETTTSASEPLLHQHVESLQPVLLSVFESLGVEPHSCVYVSRPITTGSRYLRWRIGLPSEIEPGTRAYERGRQDVRDANLADAQALVADARGRFRRTHVIDPAALVDVKEWEQPDYHRYWTDVIKGYVNTMIMAEGWNFSDGCATEFETAVELELDVFDHKYEPITPSVGLALLQEAIREYSRARIATERLCQVEERLRRRIPQPQEARA